MLNPSRYFSDCETAIETVCRGCDKERGWIDIENSKGKPCYGLMALGLGDEVEGYFKDVGGRFVCTCRRSKADNEKAREKELYEKRMRGEW